MALEVNKDNFDEIVNGDKPVMLDFWAEWCGPCRMVGPIVDELATEYEGKAIIGKVNVDNEQELAAKFGVRSIPTILFVKGGEVVEKSVGAVPKTQLEDILARVI